MGWLQQEIAAAGERRRGPGLEPAEKLGRQMRIRAKREAEGNALVEQPALQRRDPRLDPRGVVLVEPRVDVRRARGGADAVGDRDARHRERGRLVGRAVVDAGQEVAVKVNHCPIITANDCCAVPRTHNSRRRGIGRDRVAPRQVRLDVSLPSATDAGMEHHQARAANHIALAGMCNAKSNALCSIIGTMPSPAASCNSVKLRPTRSRSSADASAVDAGRERQRRGGPAPPAPAPGTPAGSRCARSR